LTRVEHAPAGRRRPSLLGGSCGSKIEPSAAFRGGVLNAPRHPRHSGEARVPRRPMKELRPGFFPLLISSYKIVLPIAKKQEGLDICLLG